MRDEITITIYHSHIHTLISDDKEFKNFVMSSETKSNIMVIS